MAEFSEVMRQFERMCHYYQGKCECPMGCSMDGVNISQCRKIAVEHPDVTEKKVMSWAAEHPEPKYPTWLEWLHTTSATDDSPDIPVGDGTIFRVAINNIPIPVDIAKKLGIEPKEERDIVAWAAENPEPVYPTWYEWLTIIGAVTPKVKPDVVLNLIETGLLDPIPADIAEKLGIEPKEDK